MMICTKSNKAKFSSRRKKLLPMDQKFINRQLNKIEKKWKHNDSNAWVESYIENRPSSTKSNTVWYLLISSIGRRP